jgi:hypothetical protein
MSKLINYWFYEQSDRTVTRHSYYFPLLRQVYMLYIMTFQDNCQSSLTYNQWDYI